MIPSDVPMPSLPNEVVAHTVSFLSSNVTNCTIRLINKAAAMRYRDPTRRPIVRLSQPVPRHAFARRCTRAWTRMLSYQRRLQLLCLTAASGDLTNLELAVGAAGCVLRGEVMEAAAAAGHLHVCQWLWQWGCPWGNALVSAAGTGKRELCEWLLSNGCPLTHIAVSTAARHGHLGLMAWLWQRISSKEWDTDIGKLLPPVAHGCDLPTLQLFYSSWRRPRMLRQQVHQQQAAQQRLRLVEQQLSETELQLEQLERQKAAAQGAGVDEPHPRHQQLQLLLLQRERRVLRKWRRALEEEEVEKQQVQQQQQGLGAGEQQQQQQPMEEEEEQQQQQQQQHEEERMKEAVLVFACDSPTSDWRDKVMYLEAQGCPPTLDAAVAAARVPGEAAVERLRWLRERGYPLGSFTASLAAASEGNPAALEYLLGEAGVRVQNSRLGYFAATNGHLAVLQLLHARGCPVGPLSCLADTAKKGHLHIVSWLVDTFGLTAADLQQHAVRPAAESGSMELVDWLVGRGCDLSGVDDILTRAAEGGCEAMLERLVELGCPWPDTDNSPYVPAALNGDLATLDCLRRLDCPWGSRVLARVLSGPGMAYELLKPPMLPVLRWLVEAGCPVDWDEALEAARSNQWLADGPEVVAWLEERGGAAAAAVPGGR